MSIPAFSTELLTVLGCLTAVGVAVALRWSWVAMARWSDSAVKHKLDLLSNDVIDLAEKYDHQTKLYRRLIARQDKRSERAEEKPAPDAELPASSTREPGEPDPFTEQEAWKKWARLRHVRR